MPVIKYNELSRYDWGHAHHLNLISFIAPVATTDRTMFDIYGSLTFLPNAEPLEQMDSVLFRSTIEL